MATEDCGADFGKAQELVVLVVGALADMTEGEREHFFFRVSRHYNTCCGEPVSGWCACNIREDAP